MFLNCLYLSLHHDVAGIGDNGVMVSVVRHKAIRTTPEFYFAVTVRSEQPRTYYLLASLMVATDHFLVREPLFFFSAAIDTWLAARGARQCRCNDRSYGTDALLDTDAANHITVDRKYAHARLMLCGHFQFVGVHAVGAVTVERILCAWLASAIS